MRPRFLLAATGLALILAAFYFPRRAQPPQSGTIPEAPQAPSTRASRLPSPASTAGSANSSEPAPTLSPALENEIEEAVVTYSPEALPFLGKLLASGEPDVREAARDGLVRLGEKGGAVLLRRATAKLTDPEEIKKFLETADYLELPSALEGPLKK